MAQHVRQAVILVGGKGTRLLPLTERRPKPALPVLDKPCLRYLIDSLAAAGAEEIILACGYRSDVLEEAIGDGSGSGASITYSYEDEPLGTCGAVKMMEDRLDDVFFMANGDVFADIAAAAEAEAHFASGAKVTLALATVKNPCEYGIARLAGDGRILEFKEKPKPEEAFSNVVNAGVYVVDRSVLSRVPKGAFFDFSKDLLPILMSEGERIQGYALSGYWRDVGRPSDLLGANLQMAGELYGDFSWSGKRTESTTIVRPFYLGEGSTVTGSDVNAAVILGGCSVRDSRIVKSMVMGGCEASSAKIENSIIGEGCRIGAGARIENSVLADGTVVPEGAEINRGEVFR
ncbi:MAG: NDP-sugar synthase [Candidatus Methanoplasma sp.]|jgi:mannose-1-phosphate guanylyltransferase|nr:NDP-sugar synthase [Candidatus Methanoplasma sp.]